MERSVNINIKENNIISKFCKYVMKQSVNKNIEFSISNSMFFIRYSFHISFIQRKVKDMAQKERIKPLNYKIYRLLFQRMKIFFFYS